MVSQLNWKASDIIRCGALRSCYRLTCRSFIVFFSGHGDGDGALVWAGSLARELSTHCDGAEPRICRADPVHVAGPDSYWAKF
jgi:hypothetical protein